MEKRFWSKVDRSGGADSCWPWTAGKTRGGYGQIKADGKLQRAHRVAWTLANGPIPKGEGAHGTCVLHRCDVPACCNPGHLFLGTQAENMADMGAKGRGNQPQGEAHWRAKLTAEQVVEIRAEEGTQTAIAARFGIGRTQVSRIRAGTRWAHLSEPNAAACGPGEFF